MLSVACSGFLLGGCAALCDSRVLSTAGSAIHSAGAGWLFQLAEAGACAAAAAEREYVRHQAEPLADPLEVARLEVARSMKRPEVRRVVALLARPPIMLPDEPAEDTPPIGFQPPTMRGPSSPTMGGPQ